MCSTSHPCRRRAIRSCPKGCVENGAFVNTERKVCPHAIENDGNGRSRARRFDFTHKAAAPGSRCFRRRHIVRRREQFEKNFVLFDAMRRQRSAHVGDHAFRPTEEKPVHHAHVQNRAEEAVTFLPVDPAIQQRRFLRLPAEDVQNTETGRVMVLQVEQSLRNMISRTDLLP